MLNGSSFFPLPEYFTPHLGEYVNVLSALEKLNVAILKAMDKTKEVSNDGFLLLTFTSFTFYFPSSQRFLTGLCICSKTAVLIWIKAARPPSHSVDELNSLSCLSDLLHYSHAGFHFTAGCFMRMDYSLLSVGNFSLWTKKPNNPTNHRHLRHFHSCRRCRLHWPFCSHAESFIPFKHELRIFSPRLCVFMWTVHSFRLILRLK